MRAERAEKSEKKSRKKTKKWREIKKKLIKKSTVYQLREFSTVLYITKEEYVFVLNELSKLNNYALTMPKDVEETNITLTSMPIECAIVERYSVLYDLMFEAEYVQKDVDDETLVSDRERDYTDFLIGKKFSASFDLDKEYQDYLNQKTLLGL